MQTISILGCGWLGLPLAAQLVKEGYAVYGSTTDEMKLSQLRENGIKEQLLTYSPERQEDPLDFFRSDILFLNIPFKRNLSEPSFYSRQIAAVLKDAREGSVSWVIFASSTSIYADEITTAEEGSPLVFSNERIRALYESERMILNDDALEGTVIRFGGLVGGKRRIGRFLAGRKKVSDPHKPVNLIHRDDCIGILAEVIKKDVRGEIFNAVCDEHPSREELYTEAARKVMLEPPRFDYESTSGPYKIVANDKIKKALGYRFKRPDPKEFV